MPKGGEWGGWDSRSKTWSLKIMFPRQGGMGWERYQERIRSVSKHVAILDSSGVKGRIRH